MTPLALYYDGTCFEATPLFSLADNNIGAHHDGRAWVSTPEAPAAFAKSLESSSLTALSLRENALDAAAEATLQAFADRIALCM